MLIPEGENNRIIHKGGDSNKCRRKTAATAVDLIESKKFREGWMYHILIE